MKTTLYKTYMDLAFKFYNNPELRDKYFPHYGVKIVKTLNCTKPILTIVERNAIRETNNIDYVELQTSLHFDEQINVGDISNLTRALINYLIRFNKDNGITTPVEEHTSPDEECLSQIIDEVNSCYGHVEPKVVLDKFGIKPKDFKKFDQQLSKLLSTKGYVKSRKRVNGILKTIYEN